MLIYSKITSEHPCKSVISTSCLGDFIEITIVHGCYAFGELFLKQEEDANSRVNS